MCPLTPPFASLPVQEVNFVYIWNLKRTPRKTNGWNLDIHPWFQGKSSSKPKPSCSRSINKSSGVVQKFYPQSSLHKLQNSSRHHHLIDACRVEGAEEPIQIVLITENTPKKSLNDSRITLPKSGKDPEWNIMKLSSQTSVYSMLLALSL